MPGDLDIAVAIWIVSDLTDGELLAYIRCAVDGVGGITVIHKGDELWVALQEFLESLPIGIGNVDLESHPLELRRDGENASIVRLGPVDAISGC